MKIGMLYAYDEKKFDKDLKSKNPPSIGVDAESLLDDINILEVQSGYNLAVVLAQLKLDIMKILSKVSEVDEVKKDVGNE